MSRAQSHVVGVALLLAITVAGLGGLTAAVGGVLHGHAATADSQRVADTFASTLDPARTTGVRTGRVAFSRGSLTTVNRTVRVLANGSVVASAPANALVYRTRDRRVAFVAGAVVTGRGDAAALDRRPSIAVGPNALDVGVPVLTDQLSVGGSGGVALALRVNVTHHRRALGTGTFGVAVETSTPAPWQRYFDSLNATTRTRDFDDDGTPSVVARFSGTRRGFLVLHRTGVSVS